MKSVILGWKLFPVLLVAGGGFVGIGSLASTIIAQAPTSTNAPVQEMMSVGKTTGTALGVLAALVGLGLHYQDRSAQRAADGTKERDATIGAALLEVASQGERTAKENRDSVRRLYEQSEARRKELREEERRNTERIMDKVVGGLASFQSTLQVALETRFRGGGGSD